ncbi:MAG: metallophosphoesterase family protein [Marmoricola sp.]
MAKDLKIFFVTDIHGSETCWRKFLNAGAFYGADVVIVGGDITGKAMVPIVRHARGWETTMFGEHVSLSTSDEVAEVERKVRNRGYYPQQMTESEYAELRADPEALDRRFTRVMIEETQRWIEMADDKLQGKVHRVIVCPANDDMFELDPLLHQEGHVVETSGDEPIDLEGFEMVSMGFTNPTPWHTFREVPDEDLARRLEEVTAHLGDPSRAIFNFHAPPYGSGLDEAPALTDDLRIARGGAPVPVGSKAVRDAIERVQPLLGLHGHIHESRAAKRSGRTLVLNPGSSYEQGILQGALVTLDRKKAKVKSYVLVNG